MTKEMKNASTVNNSSHTSTSAHETGIKSFSFEGTINVRVLIINSEPWFVASDVCNILAHTNASTAVQMLDDDERTKIDPKKSLGSKSNEPIWIVNESGLYALIMRSNKPNARKFRKWVTSEVLPSIRKTGMYATPQTSEKLSGQYVQVTGADENLYLLSILKVMREFLGEELRGNSYSELRLAKGIEAARTLFPEDKRALRSQTVKIK